MSKQVRDASSTGDPQRAAVSAPTRAPSAPKRAPAGNLASFEREHFEHDGFAHAVYRKGSGPAVLVIAELPGITPQLLGFADRVVALGCTAVLPDLFGRAGYDVDAQGRVRFHLYTMKTALKLCVNREFGMLAAGRSAPVVDYLRALAAREHERCGGPGVGVVGMCFTGGYALAMAADDRVLAPVLAQPALPVGVRAGLRAGIDCDPEDLARVKQRCAGGLTVLGVRFKGDPLVPAARFAFLREQLGDAFVGVELPASCGHPDSLVRPHHSVLTRDLIDEPGQPTYEALEQVLRLFETRLLKPSER
jgi:dienelactone hydrolase